MAAASIFDIPVSAQTATPSPDPGATQTADAPDAEVPEGELAPAAVHLDVSNASKLIQVLYAATRETKTQTDP
jgi:uncharacterized protein (DUF2126 family)